jgi:sulfopyruvate decarboxylase subunit beta
MTIETNQGALPRRSIARTMPVAEALAVLAGLRTDEIVVTTMGAAREWPKLSHHPLDFHYLPSAMGQAPMLGLGLALARSPREVIVLNGDGSMLMNLGSLVTIAASGAQNLTLVVLENGIYEVTGGQTTAAAASAAPVDLAAIARGAGIASAAMFDDLDHWRADAAAVLSAPGPRFVVLRVAPAGASYQLPPPPSMSEQVERLMRPL